MARVALEGVSKTYPGGIKALSGVDLIVESGERLVLLGPSGSGKSTLLRIVAGLESADGGVVRIGDANVASLPPHLRDVSLAFQQVVLFPHWSVRESLAFGLRKQGWRALLCSLWPLSLWSKSEAAVNKLAVKAAEDLGIADLLDRSPGSLSGGERQRVALGRALVRKPAVFLFDEPLASVDPHRRFALRQWIAHQTGNGLTATIYVTHDREEALLLGDRVAVMSRGRIEQVGTPCEICESPSSLTVAEFIHGGALNILSVALSKSRLAPESHPAFAAIPPDAIKLTTDVQAESSTSPSPWTGIAEVSSARYAATRQEIRLENVQFSSGEAAESTWTASASTELQVRPQQQIAWTIDSSRVLWFDETTHLAIPKTLHGA
jgi:sn-glycerol 3-phosphate transport system ATP-binding protein